MGRVGNRYVWQGGQTENQGGHTKKIFRRFAPNFAHPGLKPCRRPCLQETVLPPNRWKAETFASLGSLWPGIWQLWPDLVFGPEGYRKVVTWPSRKLKIYIIDTRIEIQWFQKCHCFRSTTKNNEVIAEKPFHDSGVTRRLWTLGRLELTLIVNTSF